MQRRTVLAGALVAAVATLACSDTVPPAPSPLPTTPPVTMPAPAPPAAPVADTARYEMQFESTWSPATHPTDFPSDAHYSPLVGGTHTAAVAFWQEGQPASPGIQAMAERGRTSPLDAEINAAIAQGQAQTLLLGDALDDSPGRVALEFDVTRAFPVVTLVTMVAPSPDWFVGVAGLALFANGDWRDQVTVEVFAFDAGTDSGTTYRSDNAVTAPPQPIMQIRGYPLSDSSSPLPFGTMVFTRK